MIWHPGIALAITALIGLATGNWAAGAAMAIGIFAAREHAQAEYRWIERYGAHHRANMPWWGGFDPRVWNERDAWIDWIAPVIAAVVLAILAHGNAGLGGGLI